MTYLVEFPDFPPADMPKMPEGFEDESHHNDLCPSFSNGTLKLMICVDYKDETLREFADASRFTVHQLDDEGMLAGDDVILETNDWAEIEALVEKRKAETVG